MLVTNVQFRLIKDMCSTFYKNVHKISENNILSELSLKFVYVMIVYEVRLNYL